MACDEVVTQMKTGNDGPCDSSSGILRDTVSDQQDDQRNTNVVKNPVDQVRLENSLFRLPDRGGNDGSGGSYG